MVTENKKHTFHLVDLSIWPMAVSFGLLILAIGAVMAMHSIFPGGYILSIGFALVVFFAYKWWSDVIHEGRVDKAHTKAVSDGLRMGMGLFIFSEVAFFFAFFFAYFMSALLPAGILDEAGLWVVKAGVWPPKGINTFDPWDLPFMNTMILLLSGNTITWAHHSLVHNDRKNLVLGLALTVALGVLFTCMQAFEYHHAHFGMKDGIYAANFFLATGFHGLHVIIGTIFLFVCLIRAQRGHFDKGHGHLGFEFAAWYWHFVDVVWLFLFVFVYVWGR